MEDLAVLLFGRITPAYAGKRFERVSGKSALTGSPLRMRGKDRTAGKSHTIQGITHAYAGKSFMDLALLNANEDHPCVCGEKLDKKVVFQGGKGSPLRMRGKARKYHRVYIFRRITPAYAGKSLAYAEGDYLDQDHPCVCGEKTVIS